MIPYAGVPQPDAPAKYWIKQGLRAAGLTTPAGAPCRRAAEPDAGLPAAQPGLYRDERKAASKRVNELVKGEDFGDAVAQTLVDIEAVAAGVR